MKAILVIDDMPRECGDCPCIHDELWTCQADKQFREGTFRERPSWCPLRPIPNDVSKDDVGVYVKGYMDSLVGRVDDEGETDDC